MEGVTKRAMCRSCGDRVVVRAPCGRDEGQTERAGEHPKVWATALGSTILVVILVVGGSKNAWGAISRVDGQSCNVLLLLGTL